MYATRKQQTIAAPVTLEGVGYWSGEDVRVDFCPAPGDTGITFVRGDLPGRRGFPPRSTTAWKCPAARPLPAARPAWR